MPYDRDDDDLTDVKGWLKDQMRRHKAAHAPPEWPSPAQRRGWVKAVLGGAIALAMLILAAIAKEAGVTIDPGDVSGDTAQVVVRQPLYAQRKVRVHSAPYGDSAVLRVLEPGERVLWTPTARSKWVRLFDGDGHVLGFAYNNNENLLSAPPLPTYDTMDVAP